MRLNSKKFLDLFTRLHKKPTKVVKKTLGEWSKEQAEITSRFYEESSNSEEMLRKIVNSKLTEFEKGMMYASSISAITQMTESAGQILRN